MIIITMAFSHTPLIDLIQAKHIWPFPIGLPRQLPHDHVDSIYFTLLALLEED